MSDILYEVKRDAETFEGTPVGDVLAGAAIEIERWRCNWIKIMRAIAEATDNEMKDADGGDLAEEFDPWECLCQHKIKIDRLRKVVDVARHYLFDDGDLNALHEALRELEGSDDQGD